MNKGSILRIVLVSCLIISSVCWVIHISTDIEIAKSEKCEHEFVTTINIPLTAALYTTQETWIPTFITKCVKCGRVGSYE